MRRLLVVMVISAGMLAAAQGLSPKAGALSDGLYTNLYFGMNYKLPSDLSVSFVASTGPCEKECLLLDARVPGEKSRRTLTISAEQMKSSEGAAQVEQAGMELEQAGAKKVAAPREIMLGGRKAYRADYRSTVLDGDLYSAVVVLPAKDYAVVFSITAESRKQLDLMVDELPKAISFVSGS